MALRFDVVTLFPEMFSAVTESGIGARALRNDLWRFAAWNPRDCTVDAYRRVDDRPFGGGPGMVMLAEPLSQAIEAAKAADERPAKVVLMSPQGRPFSHAKAVEMAGGDSRHVLVCGRYEAIDERVLASLVDEEISLGDFVLSGGEIAAMAIIDACVRLLPGAMNDAESTARDSFADASTGGLLDCPHYTRPESWRDMPVPEVLLSGHHANIAQWRREQSLLATARKRPDLIERARALGLLSARDEKYLKQLEQ